MACRIDDQNKLSLISVSFPQNSVIVWDLAEQLRFPRRHFCFGFLDLDCTFARIISASQRKGEYLLINRDGRVDHFRLPRRFQKIQELAQISNKEPLQANLKKYLSTAGKSNIDQISQFLNDSDTDLSRMDPLDLFESTGFAELVIEELQFQSVPHLGFTNRQERMSSGEISADPVDVVVDEPFEESELLVSQSRVIWLKKNCLTRTGEFDFRFEVVQAGMFRTSSDHLLWVLLGMFFWFWPGICD